MSLHCILLSEITYSKNKMYNPVTKRFIINNVKNNKSVKNQIEKYNKKNNLIDQLPPNNQTSSPPGLFKYSIEIKFFDGKTPYNFNTNSNKYLEHSLFSNKNNPDIIKDRQILNPLNNTLLLNYYTLINQIKKHNKDTNNISYKLYVKDQPTEIKKKIIIQPNEKLIYFGLPFTLPQFKQGHYKYSDSAKIRMNYNCPCEIIIIISQIVSFPFLDIVRILTPGPNASTTTLRLRVRLRSGVVNDKGPHIIGLEHTNIYCEDLIEVDY